MADERKEQLRTLVRKIAVELHSQGINPTAKKVGRYLKSQSITRSPTFIETLRALRNELNRH